MRDTGNSGYIWNMAAAQNAGYIWNMLNAENSGYIWNMTVLENSGVVKPALVSIDKWVEQE